MSNTTRTFPLTSEARDDLASYIHDEWKSVYGIKNRWTDFSQLSDEQLVEMADSLEAEIVAELDSERLHNVEIKHALEHPEDGVMVIFVPVGSDESRDDPYYQSLEQVGMYPHLSLYTPDTTTPTMATLLMGAIS